MMDRARDDLPVEANRHLVPPELSLVIPAFNEELRLEAGLARLAEAIAVGAVSPESTQFIVVDDGSTDATAACATSLMASYPHVRVIRLEENFGKGAAVRAGIAAATAPLIIFADADMAIDPSQTPQFIEALTAADLAIGSRAASGASVDRISIGRSIMNRTFNRLVNTVTKVALDDTQCGFKAFRAPAAKLLFHCTVMERMAFDVEILSLARHLGLSIEQVPVHWLRVKGSRVSSWADSPSMIRDVFKARRGVDSGPPVPGILVKVTAHADVSDGVPHSSSIYLRELSARYPVIRRGSGEFLVLCPLMSEASVAALFQEMVQNLVGGYLDRTTITVAGLRAMAPLTLTWDDASVTSRAV
jgi:hypothetical protein